MNIIRKYKNTLLENRISNMESLRKNLIKEINNLDANLLEIQRLYTIEKLEYCKINKICSCCYTICNEISNSVAYCQECKDNDSCLNDN